MIYMKKGGAYHRYKKTTEKARNESTHTHTNVIVPPPPPQPPPKISPPKPPQPLPKPTPQNPPPTDPEAPRKKSCIFCAMKKGKNSKKQSKK